MHRLEKIVDDEEGKISILQDSEVCAAHKQSKN
jgi:hypothetical protein